MGYVAQAFFAIGCLCAGVVLFGILRGINLYIRPLIFPPQNLSNPLIGPQSFVGRVKTSHAFVFGGARLMEKAKSGFVLPSFDGYHHFVCSPKLVEELCNAPEENMSLHERLSHTLQAKYTLPSLFADSKKAQKMVTLVRNKVSGGVRLLFPAMYDESITTLNEQLELNRKTHAPDEAISIQGFEFSLAIMNRATNRIFIGLPVCREPDYLDATTKYARNVILGGPFLALFPDFLKPLAVKYIVNITPKLKVITRHVRAQVEARINPESGLSEKPMSDSKGDVLNWLMALETSANGTINIDRIAVQVLSLNFGAIFTSSFLLTNVLYELAYRPSYLGPLRAEVLASLERHGGQWSKAVVDDLYQLDSFLKETQRFFPHEASTVGRVALAAHTFSDGTHVGAGDFVFAPSQAIGQDEEYLTNASEFDGFRYYRERMAALARNESLEVGVKFTDSTPTMMGFGLGRHACPGRGFAAAQIKLVVGHILENYEISPEDPNRRPQTMNRKAFHIADMKTRLLFKRRPEIMGAGC